MLIEAVSLAEPGLVRTLKWGNLLFLHKGQHALALAMHKEHASLQFFNGAAIAQAVPALEGSGKDVRHLKFRYAHPVDVALVAAAVCACVRQLDQEAG